MPRPKPNKLHDELDALLDGRPVELTDELAPLAEAADQLRMELAGLRLDPGVADRHLERVLHGSAAVVRLPVLGQASGWEMRRRVVAVALAAALVLAPATIASAAALPGQAMYPFKLAIEQVRIASVQWSPPREAGERTRVAQERLHELNRLVELRMFSQIPTAVSALGKAVLDAQAAVSDASEEGQPVPGVASQLNAVKQVGGETLAKVVATVTDPSLLPAGTREAIADAVAEAQGVVPLPSRDTSSPGTPSGSTPTPTSDAKPGGGSGPDPTSAQPPPSVTNPPETTQPPAPTTTEPPTTSPPTTVAPPTTEATTPPAPGGGGRDGDGAGADGRSPVGQVPPTTLPAP